MAKIRFRFEVKLRLAKYELETIQTQLAKEQQRLHFLYEERDKQAAQLISAIEGQRQASLLAPESLGIWLNYVLKQQEKLHKCVELVDNQYKIVEDIRLKAVEVYQEYKKYENLKEKEAKAFFAKESRFEQAVFDENGQSLFNRIRRENINELEWFE